MKLALLRKLGLFKLVVKSLNCQILMKKLKRFHLIKILNELSYGKASFSKALSWKNLIKRYFMKKLNHQKLYGIETTS